MHAAGSGAPKGRPPSARSALSSALPALVFICGVLLLPVPAAAEELTALIPNNWPPHYSTDANGNPTGFAIDVLENVAARAGVRVTYKTMPDFPTVMRAFKARRRRR